MDTSTINIRYSRLAQDSCCLSCGGAIDHAAVQPGECCVDLGSGRGTDVLRMAGETGEKGFIYGIDVSEGMLQTARMNATKLGINNVAFLKSDLESLSLPSQIADLVISNCTINHASDKSMVWSEIYRIMKSGGRFVVSDIYSAAPVPEKYRNDPVAVSECWAGAILRDEYLRILNDAGFINIRIIEESDPYPKGSIEVASFTVVGQKGKCCCS